MSERTLDDALTNASRISHELPHLVQPDSTAYDVITLANEVYRLRAEIEFKQKTDSGYYGDLASELYTSQHED